MLKLDLHTRSFRHGVLGVIAALAASLTDASAASPFVSFDIPGAGTGSGQGTFATATSGKGLITGSFVDSNFIDHGFVGSVKDSFTTFDAPGADTDPNERTWPNGINSSGTVTGFYTTDHMHGFVRHSDGTFETFSVETDTNATAINNKGVVTGYGTHTGFVRAANGSITQFSPPGAASTLPLAINAKGAIAGYYFDSSDFRHGFLRSPNGTIVTFDVPGGFDHVFANSINNNGDIAGYAYISSSSVFRAFLRTSDGTITVFNPSGCPTSFASGINFDGTIVGNCFAGDFTYHGFTRFPDGTITTYDAPNAGTGGAGTFPTGIAANGKSVGHAQDNAGVHHGYRLNVQTEPPARPK